MGESRGGHSIGGQTAAHLGNLKTLLQFIGGTGSEIDVDMLDGRHVDDSKSDTNSIWTAQKVIDYIKSSAFTQSPDPTNRDLNNFTELNSYWVFDTGKGAVLNTPDGDLANGSAKVGMVRNTAFFNSRLVQEMMFIYPLNGTRYYIRNKTDGTWGNWMRMETTDGAQAKANQAEANAKAASLPLTGGTITGHLVTKASTPRHIFQTTDGSEVGSLRYNNDGSMILSSAKSGYMYFRPSGDGVDTGQVVLRPSGDMVVSSKISGRNLTGTDQILNHGGDVVYVGNTTLPKLYLESANRPIWNGGGVLRQLETTEGAQARVDASQTHKVTGDDGMGILLDAGTDMNTVLKTGFYRCSNGVNAPFAGWFFYTVIQQGVRESVQYATNFASRRTFVRYADSGGVWRDWLEYETTVGAQAKADTKLALTGGTLTGDLTISRANATLTLYDTANAQNYPKIKFGKPSNQGVQIRYNENDQEILDNAGYALIVEKTTENSQQNLKASFQVEGNIYADGKKVLREGDLATPVKNADVSGNSYPMGLSYFSISGDAGSGYPLGMATVMNLREGGYRQFQLLYGSSNGKTGVDNNRIFVRNFRDDAGLWSDWDELETVNRARVRIDSAESSAKNASVPRTGGTMTGTLQISVSNEATPFRVARVGSNSNANIRIGHDNAAGHIGIDPQGRWKIGDNADLAGTGAFIETTDGATSKANNAANNAKAASVSKTGDTMSGMLKFGAGQDLARGSLTWTEPSQGISWSADTDTYRLFMRTEAGSGEQSSLVMQLGDNTDDTFEIEANKGGGSMETLFLISQAGGARFKGGIESEGLVNNGSMGYMASSGGKSLVGGVGGADVYIRNSKAGMNLQLRDDGKLHYNNQELETVAGATAKVNAVNTQTINSQPKGWMSNATLPNSYPIGVTNFSVNSDAGFPNGFGTAMTIRNQDSSVTQFYSAWNNAGNRTYVRSSRDILNEWQSWSELETTTGAQSRANTAETNAKNASVSRSGDTMTGNLTFSGQELGVKLGVSSTPVVKTEGSWITGGSDVAGLSKLNNVAIQTWYGFSVSPSISGQAVAQGTPAFSVNARTGHAYVAGNLYVNKDDIVSTQTDAQNRATSAYNNAVNWAKGFGLGTAANNIDGQDLNQNFSTGFYRMNRQTTGSINTPPRLTGDHSWIYVIHIYHDANWSVQLSIDYNNRYMFTRTRANGVWGTWKRMSDETDWGLWRTSGGGQDLVVRDKRAMVGTDSSLTINYGSDFSSVNILGTVYKNGEHVETGVGAQSKADAARNEANRYTDERIRVPEKDWTVINFINGHSGDLRYIIQNNILFVKGYWNKATVGVTVAMCPAAPRFLTYGNFPTVGSYGRARATLAKDGAITIDSLESNNNDNVSRVEMLFVMPFETYV
jgi:hypothetical protein